MTRNDGQGTRERPKTMKRIDATSITMVAALLLMVATSLMNMRALNQIGGRLATLESMVARTIAPAPPPGPDPARVYELSLGGAIGKGPANAPVTIAEFSDFECPFCARVVTTLKLVEERYGDRVRIVWKHLPLSIHKNAVTAARAAEAAGRQGKFWEYHDLLFANQENLELADLEQYAAELKLDLPQFKRDFQDPALLKKVEADRQEADALNIGSTPSFFINGRFLRGAQPFEAFAKVIDEELATLKIPSKPS